MMVSTGQGNASVRGDTACHQTGGKSAPPASRAAAGCLAVPLQHVRFILFQAAARVCQLPVHHLTQQLAQLRAGL